MDNVGDMLSNNYDLLAQSYKGTDVKPDKRYSILPTVLQFVGDLSDKTVVDLGCGSGFFTRAFAGKAKFVIGLDNSSSQIAIAEQDSKPNITYRLSDVTSDDLPSCDVINAPFVLGYSQSVEDLKRLFVRIYGALNSGGRFVGVIDLPSGKDLKRFGATKILHGDVDGSKIEIILTDGASPICTLWATYFSPQTVESLLSEVGFKNVCWYTPIVSDEGQKEMPAGFWKGYIENSELGYFMANKA